MKQHITKEQWDSLTARQKRVYYERINEKVYGSIKQHEDDWEWMTPPIGQLIEFLGEDLICIESAYGDAIVKTKFKTFPDPDLIDALWEATKHKLKSL